TAKSIGLTEGQLAEQFQQSQSNIYLLERNYIHFILKELNAVGEKHILLKGMLEDLSDSTRMNTITGSAELTQRLVHQGLTPEQMANKRQLKITTIYDHLVEIAIYDNDFPINRFIADEQEEEIYE